MNIYIDNYEWRYTAGVELDTIMMIVKGMRYKKNKISISEL